MVKKPNHFLYRSKLRTMNVRATYVPRMPKEAMLTKLRKKDFLRTDSPALKMIGGKKNLQQQNDVSARTSKIVNCTTAEHSATDREADQAYELWLVHNTSLVSAVNAAHCKCLSLAALWQK